MNKTSIFVIHDNRLVAEALTTILNFEADFHATATDHTSEIIDWSESRPCVVLLDVGLVAERGTEFIDQVRRTAPGVQIVLMGVVSDDTVAIEALRAGVSGFLLREASSDDLRQTVRSVIQGAKVLPPPLLASLLRRVAGDMGPESGAVHLANGRLTRREREVLELIADGLSNKEIAQRLNLATQTVKSHVHHILEKMQLHTRLQLASHTIGSRRSTGRLQS